MIALVATAFVGGMAVSTTAEAQKPAGGGFSGGGFRGGGFSGGAFRGGGFSGGGFRGGMPGGFRGGMPGGFRGGMPGGFRAGNVGAFRGGIPGGFRGGNVGAFRGGLAGPRFGARGPIVRGAAFAPGVRGYGFRRHAGFPFRHRLHRRVVVAAPFIGTGFYAGYPYYDGYYDDGCLVREPVWTAWGWQYRVVNVCY
jgi:hypothetical protein